MTLIGTVVSAEGPSQSYAVIEDGRTRRQYIYRIGDFLLPDAKLTHIYRTRVIISRGDEEEVLVTALSGLKGGTTSAPAPAPSTAVPPRERAEDGGVRQVSKDRWVMDREEVDDAIAHLPELLTKARVVPNFTDGKPDGFRIFAIREDSLYAKIGLQNGDILRRVNNIDVGNPQNFLQVFERLKGEENIRIDLIRNNKEETFDYNIR
jgi:general secretion pathway protein C